MYDAVLSKSLLIRKGLETFKTSSPGVHKKVIHTQTNR